MMHMNQQGDPDNQLSLPYPTAETVTETKKEEEEDRSSTIPLTSTPAHAYTLLSPHLQRESN